jgi:hypothetical protein
MKYQIFALILLSISLYSQEIDANVTVDVQALDQEARINVATLGQDLESYIDNTVFIAENWEGEKIPVEVAVVLMGGSNNMFSGRLLLNSQRPIYNGNGDKAIVMQLIDNQWQFEYQRGAFHSYNHLRFNSFISLIDYYMLVLIGADLDTYGDEMANDAYERARQICLLGANAGAAGYETFNEPGEFTRYSHVSELLDPRYKEWRDLVASYYLDGIDYLIDEPETAKDNLRIIIGKMAVFKETKLSGPSVVLQAFFESNYMQIANLFKGYDDEQLFKDLQYLDPSNSTTYLEAKDAKCHLFILYFLIFLKLYITNLHNY